MTVDYTQPPTAAPPPPPPPPPQKSSGCWKWGCIGCSLLLILGVGGIAVLVGIVFTAIRHSDVYRGAWRTAQNDPRVIEALGTPISEGWWAFGSLHVEGGTGSADIEFSIHGPKGRARVHAVASKEAGNWRYTELTATPENGPPIDLLRP